MKVKDITSLIETIAPLHLQEDYDNAGLITGSPDLEVKGILLCLDSTEAVVEEAIQSGCNLVIAHHPIVFRGLKKFNGSNYVERTIIKALQNNIAIYAAHTNLDNVLQQGVNEKIASKIGLQNLAILQPKSGLLCKLIIYTPPANKNAIQDILFANGAGSIGLYSECSFTTAGTGTFKANEGANPSTGTVGHRSEENEDRVEVLISAHLIDKAMAAVKTVHPYEEIAYDIIPIANKHQYIGSGVVGILPTAMAPSDFLKHLKDSMSLDVIRFTPFSKNIQKVAVCGGSGSFLINVAGRQGVDAFVTADVKYHEYFDVEKRYMLCDIGHYESEIYTLEIFSAVIKEKFPNFAVIFCKENTNPIQYFK
ncbi:MAG: Nif3-like dinuclear metal center hexameric protein [Bacteroidota bacterium]